MNYKDFKKNINFFRLNPFNFIINKKQNFKTLITEMYNFIYIIV